MFNKQDTSFTTSHIVILDKNYRWKANEISNWCGLNVKHKWYLRYTITNQCAINFESKTDQLLFLLKHGDKVTTCKEDIITNSNDSGILAYMQMHGVIKSKSISVVTEEKHTYTHI